MKNPFKNMRTIRCYGLYNPLKRGELRKMFKHKKEAEAACKRNKEYVVRLQGVVVIAPPKRKYTHK
jgi:hypothetical protein